MFENMRLAFQGIWSHKMRSALTMLGIIIGIASIISIVSMMKGTNEQIKQNLIGNGNNIVEVQLCQDDNPIQLDYQSVPNGVSTISEYTRRNLMDIDHVEGVSLYTQRQYSNDVYYQNQSFSGNVNGIDENYLNVYKYQISVGRPFTTSDYMQRHKVALLDEKASVTMFAGEDPIGKTIEIKGEPFQVVGIVAVSSKSTKVINSYSDYHMYADNGSSGTVMIPNTAWPIVYQFDEPQNAALRADTTDNMTQVGETASEIINASFPTLDTSEACYDSPSIKQAAQQLQDLSDSSGKQLIWIAGISLIVGAIGVMNIMLVSVTERTREVGLKKALGAKRGVILGQFLTEASVLTCIGGLIGVISGLVLAKIISLLTGTPTAISIPAMLLAGMLSIVIGVISGVIPAVKAANLNPIDALRRD
ncbi:ABC transporter permease [Butyricicoccus intestinisimiae]|uniref:ABC transporter permease n=1 Tax=Butyricicoccus intestinisimiae TaxID=2841509 RepID=A0ABS6EN00_9FIRM|nr:ABC transporter permease [Butyricicoccus intestinisimiae]MBU5489061.1 ABC transporter permease [Butyricicoccus intestinisimiae]